MASAPLCLGNSVIYGPKQFGELEYNNPSFEPMWSLIEETGLVITFHVSTGRDPRAVGGAGGAIINYACHSMETTIEPLVQMLASGVFERHPGCTPAWSRAASASCRGCWRRSTTRRGRTTSGCGRS